MSNLFYWLQDIKQLFLAVYESCIYKFGVDGRRLIDTRRLLRGWGATWL